MPDGDDDDDDDDDGLRFVNRFVYTCALYRELCNTQAHDSRSCSRFVSRPLFLSLFLSLSRKQSEYSKVVSTLSRVRVFMEKRTMLFDGVPQRERERERERFRTTRAEKHDHARLYYVLRSSKRVYM